MQKEEKRQVGQLQQADYNDPPNRVPGDVGNRSGFFGVVKSIFTQKYLLEKTSVCGPSLTNLSRPWFYQTCTEFGWYQSSSQKSHPFGSTFPLGTGHKETHYVGFLVLV